jgi:uncharacterized protein YwqG
MSFLKANGIRGLVKKNDWPRYTEEEPALTDHQRELEEAMQQRELPRRGIRCKA